MSEQQMHTDDADCTPHSISIYQQLGHYPHHPLKQPDRIAFGFFAHL